MPTNASVHNQCCRHAHLTVCARKTAQFSRAIADLLWLKSSCTRYSSNMMLHGSRLSLRNASKVAAARVSSTKVLHFVTNDASHQALKNSRKNIFAFGKTHVLFFVHVTPVVARIQLGHFCTTYIRRNDFPSFESLLAHIQRRFLALCRHGSGNAHPHRPPLTIPSND